VLRFRGNRLVAAALRLAGWRLVFEGIDRLPIERLRLPRHTGE